MHTDSLQTTKTANKRSALIGITTLVAGVFIGLTAMKYWEGHSKAMAASQASRSDRASPSPKQQTTADWKPFQEMRDMQLHMDQMFDWMTAQVHANPKLSLFAENPGYSLSLRVQDMKDHFEVRAYLPNANPSDVNVKLANNRTLQVEVTNKSTQSAGPKNAGTQVTEWGDYAQTIRLPAAVKTEQMKIDNQKHELLITLPKA